MRSKVPSRQAPDNPARASRLAPAPGGPRRRTGGGPGGPGTPPGPMARTWYFITCALAALVLVASGFSYLVIRDVGSIGASHAITSGPSAGAQNILLMGLESRRDWNGNILPASILAKLHAGNAQAVANGTGGNATNTLILIHIFAGGKKAVGFSIPRDDWVNFAGTVGPQQVGKIDQAYGVSMYYEQAKLRQQNPAMGQDQLAFLGNEAGRRAAVATVEKLTGMHIDHFAEVNLDGFYELAKVVGGVEVCLNHAVRDPKSGANFHRGYQHLDAAQALSFVRQRDGLPNGDLDRTHRQQAFIDSVMHQLRTQGVLGDLTKVSALLSVAKQYVITDAGWNLLDFASQMRSLTSGNLVFRTLPIKGFATIDGQDANVVSVPAIQAIVHAVFFPKPVRRQARHAHGRARQALGRRHHRGRAQRRSHHRPGRAHLGRAGQGGLPGGHGGEHAVPHGHLGQLRPGRVGERGRPGPDVRRYRGAGRVSRGRAGPDPARGRRRAARRPGRQPAAACRDDRSHRRAAGRCGDRPQGRCSLRELTGGQAGPPDSGVRS